MGLLVGSLVGLLVGRSYHTKQKDAYIVPTNSPANNHINWIWMSKKIGLNIFLANYKKCCHILVNFVDYPKLSGYLDT